MRLHLRVLISNELLSLSSKIAASLVNTGMVWFSGVATYCTLVVFVLLSCRELAVTKGVLQFASKASLRDANALLTAYKVSLGLDDSSFVTLSYFVKRDAMVREVSPHMCAMLRDMQPTLGPCDLCTV